ncbi:GNAT family N-acetyltransferase [Halalkalibacter alkalisediminis]|uniref:GNAT family N-acetyltransferase n=1 Tax=Halalkalibacter alkalisediminis TaxID=935616 RepID=A0ABV6NKG8_9BACI|nr:GNAT family N-acetyltransferase [Halalkalibacter alkalisediminis]
MLIRRASNQELHFIQSYAPIVQQEATLGYMNGNAQMINYDMTQHYKGEYHVIVEKGVLCGWILIGETQMPYKEEVIGMILELYVLPRWRKHGCGEALMRYALEICKKKGFGKVQLNVFAGNNAKKLYDKLGFHDVSTMMERNI